MKIDCEIIQDLIPSYVEELCSNSTKECVEEHIQTCEECSELVKLYKEKDFTADKLEENQLDGLKKVKGKIKLQNIFSYLLILGLVIFSIYSFGISYSPVSKLVLYVMFVIVLVITNVVIVDKRHENKLTGFEKILLLAALVLILYIVLMHLYVIVNCAQGKVPFGMDMLHVGKFLNTQSWIVLAIQVIMFVYGLYVYIRKGISCNLLLNANIMGIFLILANTSLLKELSDMTTYIRNFIEITVIIVCIGVLAEMIVVIKNRHQRKALS